MLDEMGQKMFLELVKIESSLKLAAGIFLIVLVAGCTYGNKVAYDSVKRTKKSPDQIQVFEARDVKRAYRVIGLVSSDSYYMHSALKAIRKEAGELGADAIIDFGPNGNQTGMGYGYGSGMGVMGIGASYNTGFAAKAIVWE
jgi:hypothetical protein